MLPIFCRLMAIYPNPVMSRPCRNNDTMMIKGFEKRALCVRGCIASVAIFFSRGALLGSVLRLSTTFCYYFNVMQYIAGIGRSSDVVHTVGQLLWSEGSISACTGECSLIGCRFLGVKLTGKLCSNLSRIAGVSARGSRFGQLLLTPRESTPMKLYRRSSKRKKRSGRRSMLTPLPPELPGFTMISSRAGNRWHRIWQRRYSSCRSPENGSLGRPRD